MKKDITLANGEVVAVNSNLTAWTLFNLEKEGIINKSFLSTLFNAGGMQNVDLLDTFRTVYAAYRQANPKEYIDFKSFMQEYEIDMEEAFEIFGAILNGKAKNNMAKGFQAKAGKKD
ncbi:hypothetical protein [Bacillus toyonensis]|uniref:hypothetical protein n=1 Tax=Bacillus toyonensis TaxID=155322 RepID=UPI000BF9186C|nr:hypothetical protein [Bacillus toyonensis]PGE75586.1 hypothetical protein COM70_16465 [Bacillus toyonensis]